MLAIDTIPVWAIPATVVLTMLVVGAIAFVISGEMLKGMKTQYSMKLDRALGRRQMETTDRDAAVFGRYLIAMERVAQINAEVWGQTAPATAEFQLKHIVEPDKLNARFEGSVKGIEVSFDLWEARLTLEYFDGNQNRWDRATVTLLTPLRVQDLDAIRELIQRRKAYKRNG